MKSLAIVQAADILKLKSKLLEMNKAGLNFENKPQEINPAYIEKILSAELSENNYEVGALVSIMQDYGTILEEVKSQPLIYDVFFLDDSHKFSSLIIFSSSSRISSMVTSFDSRIASLRCL